MTLEDVIKQSERGNIKESISALAEYLKEEKQSKVEELVSALENISTGQSSLLQDNDKTRVLLQQILDKEIPEPKEVEFPQVQEISGEVGVKKPSWYLPMDMETMCKMMTEMMIKSILPMFSDLMDTIRTENEDTKSLLLALVNKETAETKIQPATLGSVRRANKWVRASTMDGNITGTVDGVNATFYLPWSPIPNSENVRLNQGNPLSQGEDYTISGNKLVFTNPIEVGMKMEIRAQI